MKKFITTILAVLLSLCCITGCSTASNANKTNKNTKKEIKIEKPDFETKTIKTDNASYEIPSTWDDYEIEADTSKYDVKAYAPASTTDNTISSTINICEEKSPIRITDIDDTVKEKYIEQIKTIYASASNFKFSDFVANEGDVFVLEYDINEDSGKISGHITQYMLMLKKKTVLVTASNLDKSLDIDPSEAAKYLVETYKNK